MSVRVKADNSEEFDSTGSWPSKHRFGSFGWLRFGFGLEGPLTGCLFFCGLRRMSSPAVRLTDLVKGCEHTWPSSLFGEHLMTSLGLLSSEFNALSGSRTVEVEHDRCDTFTLGFLPASARPAVEVACEDKDATRCSLGLRGLPI
ncbi:unnamed protein product [Protopolystoma xenopodis]|uniref:Uncharacterized protein n=1 Tax=Protopolystoma xenopodis TaxID=117903 RepID=A0A448XKE3_9PLAT|nr:unnamed protein product [Protopolystoma xenopodis]